MENRGVSIRSIINKDSWYHISCVNKLADIPTPVCKINNFEGWFDRPQSLYTDIDVRKFDAGERLKLVRVVFEVEAKDGKKDLKGISSMNMLCSNFLMVLFTLC